ncbi:AIPR family protein [Nocardioides sp. YJ-D4]
MHAEDLSAFVADLHQELVLSASEEGAERSVPEAFTEYMFGVLTEAGEIDGADLAMYEARAARASGFTVSEDQSTLWLFLTDYRGGLALESYTKASLDTAVRRMTGFLEQAVDGLWRQLEETSPAWDMAQRIAEIWTKVGEVRLVVLTNGDLRTNVVRPEAIESRPVHLSVWDATRLHQLVTSGRTQEPIRIDVVAMWGAPIACLGPQGDPGRYEAYLTMLPGDFIAKLYEEHGPRLLELNVRSFLQSRGKVNRGIQETIKDEPRSFLAYNNGVSMTAAEVKVVPIASGGVGISEIHDLQIVNGGQTSASLHYAKVKAKQDLSDIFVQAKLSVVEPANLMDLVPRISQFANSQNKVNMADFSANDPFHVEVEKLSRAIWAPGKDGTARMTRWFYERARGQYADAHARQRTPAKQREFKAVQPLSQKFTKTDLAKFENTWDQLPWIVSYGAEKNFREFMLRIERRGAGFKPDQDYFELLIAKALLFRAAEKLVGSLKLGGYRAQTVTYTLAKLSHATEQRLDLRAIWRSQELPPAVGDAILDLAPRVHQKVFATAGTRNISEWAKKDDCWKAILELAWDVPGPLSKLLTSGGRRAKTISDMSVAEMLNDEERAALAAVTSISGDDWFALSQWAKQTSNLQSWQRSLAFTLGRLLKAGSTPSRKQANQGALILAEARRLGFAGAR